MDYIRKVSEKKPPRSTRGPLPTVSTAQDQAILDDFVTVEKRYNNLRAKWVALNSTYKRLKFEYNALFNPYLASSVDDPASMHSLEHLAFLLERRASRAEELRDMVTVAANGVNDIYDQCEVLWPVVEAARRLCAELQETVRNA